MEREYTKAERKCATCENWGGNRSVNSAGTLVTYDTEDLCGVCYGNTHRASRHHERADAHCEHYEKWRALR